MHELLGQTLAVDPRLRVDAVRSLSATVGRTAEHRGAAGSGPADPGRNLGKNRPSLLPRTSVLSISHFLFVGFGMGVCRSTWSSPAAVSICSSPRAMTVDPGGSEFLEPMYPPRYEIHRVTSPIVGV